MELFLILEPSWAALNRAILLCDECCSIHRSLGRHVSHIKFIHKGPWSTSLLNVRIVILLFIKIKNSTSEISYSNILIPTNNWCSEQAVYFH